MKIGCVLKNKPAHLKNVHSDTPKHADIFTKKKYAGLEKTALKKVIKKI